MPWKNTKSRNRTGRPWRRRPARRVGAALTSTRWTRRKRVGQNLTRMVMWMKDVTAVQSANDGVISAKWETNDIFAVGDFTNWATFYEEFKILKVIVRLFPSNVGGESMQIMTPGAPPQLTGLPQFQRGDILSWIDQGNNDVTPTSVVSVINRSSARLFSPRRFHKRYITRAPSFPGWGTLDVNGVQLTPDPWQCSIRLYGENFTPNQAPGQQNFFYAQILYKVLFRGRRE